jgi:hypothetical protein
VAVAVASIEMPTAIANTLSPGEIGEQLRSFLDPAF